MRVKFGHTDPARIVYYPRYFEWFHDVFEELFEAASGVSYARILGDQKVGFPAVQLATEYRGPASFGDMIELEVFLSRLTPRSGTFEYRVRDEAGTLLTAASVKCVVIEMDTFKPTTFPAQLQADLAKYLEEGDDDERPHPERLR